MNSSLWLDFIQWFHQHLVLGRAVIFLLLLLVSAIFRRFISLLLTKFLFKLLPKEYFGLKEQLFKNTLIRPLKLLFQLFVVHVGFRILVIPRILQGGEAENFWLNIVAVGAYKMVVIATVTWLLIKASDFFGEVYLEKNLDRQTKMSNQLIPFLRELLKINLCILAFFVTLSIVFHVNVASIIAGLGIGGLAVALAGKETVENLFASFTIFVDQPFVVGDFVQVGTVKGTIEKVGFRSTRLRTLEKTWVTIPNKKMVDDSVENISERSSFRVHFPIVLAKENDPIVVTAFVKAAKTIIEQEELVSHEAHVYFNEVGDGVWKVQIWYWVDTRDDWKMNQVKQNVLTKLLATLQSMNIQLAERGK